MLKADTTTKLFGKAFADGLEETIIESGSINITRRSLVEFYGCGNFVAAGRLNKVLRRLHIESVSQLYKFDPFSLLRVKSVGLTTCFVAMCILDANDYSVEKWWNWMGDKKFDTYKYQAAKRARKHKQEVK